MELKPCPFCGGEALLYKKDEFECNTKPYFIIECTKWGLDFYELDAAKTCPEDYDRKRRISLRWNNRKGG